MGNGLPPTVPCPFVMDGWVSSGTGAVYNGNLQKNGQIVEAWDERKPENQIHR